MSKLVAYPAILTGVFYDLTVQPAKFTRSLAVVELGLKATESLLPWASSYDEI